MPFTSILFGGADPALPENAAEAEPDYFADLHLHDIVASITAGREAYDLAAYFREPLRDVATIAYRHEVFRDLEDDAVLGLFRAFARQMATIRGRLVHAAKAPYTFDQERWFLSAADAFAVAIAGLNRDLEAAPLRSSGLSAFRGFLADYAASDAFSALVADTQRLKASLGAVTYRLRIQGGKVTITRQRPEPDYSVEVLRTFEKFKQSAAKTYDWDFDRASDMNHVEAAIVDRVARLEPDVFASLHEYAALHRDFLDPTISRFDREIQFYVAYLDYIGRIRRAGLAFCYPRVGSRSRSIRGRDVFDLALAASLVPEGTPVVPNDIELHGPERVVVVSGPNQGGKTTFARMIGQIHHLAAIGVVVPGVELQVPLVDRIFVHFERAERVEDLSSKLEDDLRRIHRILDEATSESLLIMNESFTSTTVDDQLVIGRRVLGSIIDRGLLCVVVTFLDELASLNAATVSMVSTIDPSEPARRTFRIERRPADGLAYAMAIAEKHRLTYSSVKARLAG